MPYCTFPYYYLIYHTTHLTTKFFLSWDFTTKNCKYISRISSRSVHLYFFSPPWQYLAKNAKCLILHSVVELLCTGCFCTAVSALAVSSGPVELPVEHIRVTVGEHDLTNRETPPAQELRVRRLVLHPDYQCERFNHDIALLELDDAVGWSESVWPACLPQGSFLSWLLVSKSDTLGT